MSETTAELRTTLFRVNRTFAVWWDDGLKFAGDLTDPAVKYLLSDGVWMRAERPAWANDPSFICVLMGHEQRAIASELNLDFALYPSAYDNGSPIHTVDKEFGFKRPKGWVNSVVDEEERPIRPEIEIGERQSKAEQALMASALAGDREPLYQEGLLREV